MKQLRLSILLIFCCTIGMSHICAQTKVPTWFLSPATDEYVGVSIPATNEADAESSAIMSALIAYAAHHPEPPTDSTNVVNYASSVSLDKEESFSKNNISKIITPAFDIVRSHMSDNGELFIAIRVLNDRSRQDTCTIKYIKMMSSITSNKESETNVKERASCLYHHSGIIPQSFLYSYYTEYNQTNDNESFAYSIGSGAKKINLYSELNSDKNKNTYKYINSYKQKKGAPVLYIPVYSCVNSIHIAYIQYLFDHISENTTPSTQLQIIDNKIAFMQ